MLPAPDPGMSAQLEDYGKIVILRQTLLSILRACPDDSSTAPLLDHLESGILIA